MCSGTPRCGIWVSDVDRIQRALEFARAQRPHAVRSPVALEHAPKVEGTEPEAIAVPHPSRAPPAPAALEKAELPGWQAHFDTAAARERRVVLSGDAAPAAHAYRMLRTQVLQQARAQHLRTIGVVSAASGEGKTLTIVNLALSIAAEPNQTVLIADLDLSQPNIAALLGIAPPHGLDEWLSGTVSELQEIFVRLEGFERLRVLPTLQAVRGSSEVLAGPRGRDLLRALRRDYIDCLTFIDLPPVLLADDALTVAPLLDAVLIVVAEGKTRREDLVRMQELLRGVRVLGTVLNTSTESETRAY